MPYKQEFTLSLDKSIFAADEYVKCEFGYKNEFGYVVIPSEDTKMENEGLEHSFNREKLTHRTYFPSIQRHESGIERIKVFAKCFNAYGHQKTFENSI
jgi:hypothetical protein